jgi:hypothetical protein
MLEIITILYFLASSDKNLELYPLTGSANSTHGYLSLVHIKKGAFQIY